MKITSIFAAMPGDHRGLRAVRKIINNTFIELDIEADEINLAYNSLPYYDGIKAEYMDTIAKDITMADGIIIYAKSYYGQSGAVLQNLLEHLSFEKYQGILHGKNCFLVVYSDDGSSRQALSSIGNALYCLGADDSIRLICDEEFCEGLTEGSEFSLLVERQSEDFYRMIRQQRKFYMPAKVSTIGIKANSDGKPVKNDNIKSIKADRPDEIMKKPSQEEVMEIMGKYNEGEFSLTQKEDIAEITKFFADRFKEDSEIEPKKELDTILPNLPKKMQKPSLKQRTSSLTHYFKPGHAEGLDAEIAFIVSGKEGFDGYFTINGGECNFVEGRNENADVTVIANEKHWLEVISGKISAQKAFMIGQIKVRGNFVLLTKFDQIFDFTKI